MAACSPGDPPSVGTTDNEIIGGFPASSGRLNAIGALGVANGNGGFTPFCSGTLVSPTMVLTAKHCALAHPPAQIAFLIGPNALAPVAVVPARGATGEPTITGGVIELGSDTGIVHLATPVLDVGPLPLAALTNDRIGTRLTALGYGVQNAALTFGTRQSGSMTLRATSGSVFAAIFGTFDNFVQNGAARFFPELDPNDPAQRAQLQAEFDQTQLISGVEGWFGGSPGDAQACTGDGGGPITARVNNLTTVFGVSSWGFGSNESCTLDGSSYASMNPVTLDFVDYEAHCPLLPRPGFCDGLNVAVRCANVNEGGHRELRTDCSDFGQICGREENGTLACVDDPCEGIPAEGVCNGQVATRCSVEGEGPRHVVTDNCADRGGTCTLDGGSAHCFIPVPACAHDKCVTGGPLNPACDTCVAEICSVDPFCCNVAWDSICVFEVEIVCGEACAALDPSEITSREQPQSTQPDMMDPPPSTQPGIIPPPSTQPGITQP